MASEANLPAALLRAYRETEYRVAGGPTLHIGAPSPGLARLLSDRSVRCAAFVTACNPRSRLLEAPLNAQRQEALRGVLEAQGWRYLAGVGVHPDAGWPPEESFLVLGIARRAAQALGTRFEQNAVVWCGADAVAQLLWC